MFCCHLHKDILEPQVCAGQTNIFDNTSQIKKLIDAKINRNRHATLRYGDTR